MNVNMWLVIFLTLLSGCASSPLASRVGVSEGKEYLQGAATFISFPKDSDGYSFAIPSELHREMICKEFVDRKGNPVEACRMTFRARISGNAEDRLVSIYLLQEQGFFFTNVTPSKGVVLAADGKEVLIDFSSVRKLSPNESRYVRANIAFDMPDHSRPIEGTDGIRIFTGETAVNLSKVSSMVTQTEKNRECGLYSSSVGEGLGIAAANPIFIASDGLWRLSQVSCSLRAETQYLRRDTKNPEVSTSIESPAFEGGK